MTLFDFQMMGKFRKNNPTLEALLSLIAQWCGAYKPEERQKVSPPVSSVPNPTASIKEAFAHVKFNPGDGIVNV